jgi:hypothetical protein
MLAQAALHEAGPLNLFDGVGNQPGTGKAFRAEMEQPNA